MKNILVNFLFFLIVATLGVLLPCAAKRTTKDWSKMNLDDLEKQWEEGDEENELRSEMEIEKERLERQRNKAAKGKAFDPRSLKNMDQQEIGAMAAGMKDTSGPTMIFAEVHDWVEDRGASGSGNKEKLTKEETDKVGGRLRELAQLGGLEVTVYPIEQGSVLVSTQKGWEGKEIVDFLLSRPEVTKVSWNNQEFLPPKEEDEL